MSVSPNLAPPSLEDLSICEYDQTMFARWNTERFLHNIKVHEGLSTIEVRVTMASCGNLSVRDIRLSTEPAPDLEAPQEDVVGWNHLYPASQNMLESKSIYLDEQTYPLLFFLGALLLPQLIYIGTIYRYRPS